MPYPWTEADLALAIKPLPQDGGPAPDHRAVHCRSSGDPADRGGLLRRPYEHPDLFRLTRSFRLGDPAGLKSKPVTHQAVEVVLGQVMEEVHGFSRVIVAVLDLTRIVEMEVGRTTPEVVQETVVHLLAE